MILDNKTYKQKMKRKYLTKNTLLYFFLLSSGNLFSQERGLDEKINEAFTPIANWWEGLILHNFLGTGIPTIIILLVGGALFFTFYFGFVNIRHFSTAINTVRGKYDSLEENIKKKQKSQISESPDITQSKTDHGEVSHLMKLGLQIFSPRTT